MKSGVPTVRAVRRIPLAGKGCVRDCARRRVSERNRRKAALSAEITPKGIHRRLKPISGYFISADWEPSSKQTRLIRHRRRFACFSAPLKSLVFRPDKGSENLLSGTKRLFRHAELHQRSAPGVTEFSPSSRSPSRSWTRPLRSIRSIDAPGRSPAGSLAGSLAGLGAGLVSGAVTVRRNKR